MKDKSGLYIVGIVGVVAVVAIIVLIIGAGNTGRSLGWSSANDNQYGQALAPAGDSISSTTTSCTDSDINPTTGNQYVYSFKGTTIQVRNGVTRSYPDTCDSAGKNLTEYACSGTNVAKKTLACPYKCSNGACVSKPTGDTTPRIAYWPGKVNQHIESGSWVTDRDGVSGADLSASAMLAYCKKWYPTTATVVPYKNESIIGWTEKGNANYYTSTKQSYRCLPACADSDGGLNYAVAGKISGVDRYNQGNPGYDYCGPDNVTLMEGFCDSGYANFMGYTCPYRCVAGACVNAPTTSWRCEVLGNHVAIVPPNQSIKAQVSLYAGRNFTYTDKITGETWILSLLGANPTSTDSVENAILSVFDTRTSRYVTKTITPGKSYNFGGLVMTLDSIILPSIYSSTSVPSVSLYVIPYSRLGADSITTEARVYCDGQNQYNVSCPKPVDKNSKLVYTLTKYCLNGCNSCVPTTTKPYCTDSDYDNQYKPGVVSGINSYGGYKYRDKCKDNNILTEYTCLNGTPSTKAYTCELTGVIEDACDIDRCIPSYCMNGSILMEQGMTYNFEGRYGPIVLSILNWSENPETIGLRVIVDNGTAVSDLDMVTGDWAMINGQRLYVKDIFLSTIGTNTASAQICYEPGMGICIDSDGGNKGQENVRGIAAIGSTVVEDVCNLKIFNGMSDQYNLVNSCGAGTDCYVNEGICSPEYSYDSARGLGTTLIQCPYGCSEGACLSGNKTMVML